ncbi:hypothetical protein RBH26_06005 [Natronolimnohabitans sp. A-GB9]|uniref:hypothetical protein n=1 Tax=Natronolimnohabitans sp. A-GB9 TaxID=3069757 RepID=UPI0027B7D1DA|nr:hypothetical protein [Natronolimnohabitans sp. A-GB9]MDQ2050033.1 hypothetical protein [Natronolimnohabitans sp. A-GB9]
MNKRSWYHLLMGVTGLSVGLVGFNEMLSTGVSLGGTLMIVGAFAFLAQTGYGLFVERSTELKAGESVEIAAISAILCSFGALLHFLV